MVTYPCPRCGRSVAGKVAAVAKIQQVSGEITPSGQEPFFGYRLHYLTTVRGRVVWAVNRDHLEYLIGWIGARLRQKTPDGIRHRTQSHTLPTFMTAAGNRDAVVKALTKLRDN